MNKIVCMLKKALLLLLAALLVVISVLFYQEKHRPEYRILIGTSTQENSDQDVGFYFSSPITKKQDATLLLLSLLRAEAIDSMTAFKKQPDMTIWLGEWNQNITDCAFSVWFIQNDIIVKTNSQDSDSKYRKIQDTDSSRFNAVIEKYRK